MNGVARNQLAVFFDLVNDIVKVIARLLKGIFARFDFIADLKPEMLRIYLLNLIEHPILDLKNNETDILTE